MKLIIFSSETLPSKMKNIGGGNKAKVSFSKNGMIIFNKVASELSGLKVTDKLSLGQDPAHPEKWYFFKDEAGYPLKPMKGGGFYMSHKELVTSFIGFWEFDLKKSHRFQVCPEVVLIGGKKAGTEYWLLEQPGI